MNSHARLHSVLLLYYTDDEIGRDGKKRKWGGVIPVHGIPNLPSKRQNIYKQTMKMHEYIRFHSKDY